MMVLQSHSTSSNCPDVVQVNSFWALEREPPGAVSGVTLVSVGGGRNDVLVSPLSVASPFAHVVATSTAVSDSLLQ